MLSLKKKKFEGFSYVGFSTVDLAFDSTTGAFIWGTLVVMATSTETESGANEVVVTLHGFDFETGEDVYQGAAAWLCATDDGVIFLAEDHL
jgi:hypothetical protein